MVGCSPQAVEEARAAPVILLRTENLEPPAVRDFLEIYKPTRRMALDSDGADSAALFYVTVISGRPAGLRLELEDLDRHDLRSLSRVESDEPSAGDASSSVDIPLRDDTRALLKGGQPVFWLTNSRGLEVRMGVAIPMSLLTRDIRLRLYDALQPDGSPLHYATLELVRDFYYMAVLGDSVTWGNGLSEGSKFSAIVARQIERQLGVKVISQRHAHSGSVLHRFVEDGECRYDCFGEVPLVGVSIPHQIELIERPELVELLLINGCINDVGLPYLLVPETDENELIAVTRQFCGPLMEQVLRSARARMPNAWTVVVGYYPIVSEQSDLFGLEQYALTQPQLPGKDGPAIPLVTADQIAEFKAEATAQCAIFHEESSQALSAAVAQVRADTPGQPPVLFVDPGFQAENAVFAPRKLLWSMTDSNPLFDRVAALVGSQYYLFPEDQTQDLRLKRCLDPLVPYTVPFCLYVSVGHPNAAGALRYADRILDALRSEGLLTE